MVILDLTAIAILSLSTVGSCLGSLCLVLPFLAVVLSCCLVSEGRVLRSS